MMNDDKLVRIGIEDADGEIRVKEIQPIIARQLGAVMISMADEVEGVEPHKLAVRRRWKPWGTRDRVNLFAGYMIGSNLVWAGSDWNPWNWVFFGIQTAVAIAGLSVQFIQDRQDARDEEKRTGRPAWE